MIYELQFIFFETLPLPEMFSCVSRWPRYHLCTNYLLLLSTIKSVLSHIKSSNVRNKLFVFPSQVSHGPRRATPFSSSNCFISGRLPPTSYFFSLLRLLCTNIMYLIIYIFVEFININFKKLHFLQNNVIQILIFDETD